MYIDDISNIKHTINVFVHTLLFGLFINCSAIAGNAIHIPNSPLKVLTITKIISIIFILYTII